MSDLGRRLEGLSPEKRSLLEKQLLKRRQAAQQGQEDVTRLHRRQPDEPLVLSFAQQQLWFLDQWTPGNSAYNASLNIRFDGPMDEEVLTRAFQTIVERHETMRTVVADEGGIPKPVLVEKPVVELVEIDLRGDEPPSDEAIAGAVADLVGRPFDLAHDLMLRPGLIRLSESSRVVCIVMHHIACDGLSRGILFDELRQLYDAYLRAEPSPLADLPVQYSDYALWQSKWLQGAVLKGEVDFWRQQLAGTDLVLDLPTDHPRPDVLSFKGGHLPLSVPTHVAESLKAVSREERATTYMLTHAITGAFLHGLTNQESFLLGSPVANRRWPETEPLIGFFINTVVFPVRLDGDPSMRDLLRRSRDTAIACYGHQELPFERLVQALRPKRRSDRNALFQVNLRVQGAAPAPPTLDGLTSARVPGGAQSSRFDLALGFVDAPGQLDGYVEYSTALFTEPTITRWMEGFVEMLALAASDPDLPLSRLVEPVRRSRQAVSG